MGTCTFPYPGFPLSDSNRCVFQGRGATWLPLTSSRLTIRQDISRNELRFFVSSAVPGDVPRRSLICGESNFSGRRVHIWVTVFTWGKKGRCGWSGWIRYSVSLAGDTHSSFASQIWIADSKASNGIGPPQPTAGWRLCFLISITMPHSSHTQMRGLQENKNSLVSISSLMPPCVNVITALSCIY